MAIKNYTTKVPAGRSIEEIEQALMKHGATGILKEWEKGTGFMKSVKFMLSIQGKNVGFALPCNWQLFQEVLKQQEVYRAGDDEYCYRVAWRCIRDWVLAQLALYETQIVELPQVFLPFAVDRNGKTLYEQVADGKFLLGNGE
jgi:hypothetical protein